MQLRRRPRRSPCDMVVVAAGIRPNVDAGRAERARGRARHRRRRPDARVGRADRHLRRRRVRAAPRRGLRAGRAAVGAGQGARRPPHRRRPDGGRTTVRAPRRSSRSPGVDVAAMGVTAPERRRRRVRAVLRAAPRRVQERRRPRRQAGRRDAARRRQQGRAPHPGVRPAARRCPRSASRCCSTSARPPPRSASPSCRRRRPGLQLQRRQQGRDRRRACSGGVPTVAGVMDATRAGKGCGSCKTLVAQIVEWAAGGDRRGRPSAYWYVPGIPLAKPELMAAIREQDLRSVSAVFAALAPGRRGRRAQDGPGLAAAHDLGRPTCVDERDARFINDRVHANIQRDGTFSVVPQMKGGVTTAGPAAPHRRRRRQVRRPDGQAHRRAAHRPARHPQGGPAEGVGGPRHAVRVRVRQELPDGARPASAPTSAASASATPPRWASRSRRGTRAWRPGEAEARGRPAARATAPRRYVKDLGVVAVDGGRWEIYVGGAAGAHIRKGDLLATVDTPEEVITLTGRFIQYYRENGELARAHLRVRAAARASSTSAPSSSTTPRASPRRSTRACRRPSTRYRDPWKERDDPADARPVPHRAAADRAAAGAGPMSAGRARRPRLGGRQIPVARAARTRSRATRSPSSGCATAPSGRWTPSARTAAVPSPTG